MNERSSQNKKKCTPMVGCTNTLFRKVRAHVSWKYVMLGTYCFFLFFFFGGKMGIFLYVLVVLRADVAFFFGRTVIDVGVSPDRPTDVRFPSSRTLLYRWYARVFRSMNSKLWTETRLTWSCTCAATGWKMTYARFHAVTDRSTRRVVVAVAMAMRFRK